MTPRREAYLRHLDRIDDRIYDGCCELMPMLRAWARRRGRLLWAWVKHGVLRRPIPAPPASRLDFTEWTDSVHEAYLDWKPSDSPVPMFGLLRKKGDDQ